MTDEKKQKHWFVEINPALRIVIELSALIALIGTVLSIILNSLLFRNWNVAFVDIATPTDILMSGVNLSLASILVGAVALAAYVVVYLVDNLISRTSRLVGITLRTVLVVLAIAGVLCFSSDISWLLGASVAAGALIASMRIHFADRMIGRVSWSMAVLYFAVVGVAALQVYDTLSRSEFDVGLAVPNRPDLCPVAIAAVWVGDKSIVGRCVEPEISYVVIPRDGTPLIDEKNWEQVQQARSRDAAMEYPLGPSDWLGVERYSSEVGVADYANRASIHKLADGSSTIELIRVYEKPGDGEIYYTRADLNVDCDDRHLKWTGWVHFDNRGDIIQKPSSPNDLKKIASWTPSYGLVNLACSGRYAMAQPVFGSILADAPKQISRSRDNYRRSRDGYSGPAPMGGANSDRAPPRSKVGPKE